MFILSQVIAAFAIFVWVISVQQKKKKDIILCQTVANALYSIQYLFLGAFSAMSMNITSFLRGFIFYMYEKENKKPPKYIAVIFILIIIVLGIITFDSILILIPVIITIFYTYSVWQDNIKRLRIIFIIAAVFWIYYNFKVGAYVSIIGNILEIISGITAIFRLDKKTNNNK